MRKTRSINIEALGKRAISRIRIAVSIERAIDDVVRNTARIYSKKSIKGC